MSRTVFGAPFALHPESCEMKEQMIVTGFVIEIKGRFYIGIINNRVRTAWRHEGAKVFARFGGLKELREVIAELHRRGKSPVVRAVGYWLSSYSHRPEKAKVAV